jgi:hypothetical protein
MNMDAQGLLKLDYYNGTLSRDHSSFVDLTSRQIRSNDIPPKGRCPPFRSR